MDAGPTADDPLRYWFESNAIGEIRRWANYAHSLSPEDDTASRVIFVALFRIVREQTIKFQGSNPTWVRRAKGEHELVASAGQTRQAISDQIDRIRSRINKDPEGRSAPACIATASSRQLPLANNTVTASLTSPPYLTRIDYAVAYARELAVLGIDVWNGSLRHDLMGTTLTRTARPSKATFASASRDLLDAVGEHKSKASGNYYLNQTLQYLHDLCAGLDEVTRVSQVDATLTLVVQDSYYKDIHVRLAEICVSEAEKRGWVVTDTSPWHVKRSLVDLNRNARAYTKGDVSETVVRLQLRD